MKRVFLTIDDGPSERCGELVEFLESKRIGAVLFCQGDYLSKRPDPAIKAIKAGFIIGNHSFDHKKSCAVTEGEAYRQITQTDKIIDELYRFAERRRPAK